MTPTIRIDNISKRYRVAANTAGPMNLSETLATGFRNTVQKFRRLADPSAIRADEEFWALKDVSFDVQPGEVVGIVGKNGAGKSTLLKVLSRITEPTAGRIEIRGRLGSLLEVGTGFHPELTGRENVFLNGSIIGMSRAEIRRQFDAIVAFSEIGPFLDTPVKRYSSGMYVRLAFAVAAHLDPEILIVDEVLAVGDAAFQKKCLDKMRSVAQDGRTVLVVSHQTAAIRGLCTRAVLLERGRVTTIGRPDDVLAAHLLAPEGDGDGDYDLTEYSRKRSLEAVIRRARIIGPDGRPGQVVLCGSPFELELDLALSRAAQVPQVGIGVDDSWGQRVFSVASYLAPDDLPPLDGTRTVRCRIPELCLVPGRYSLSLSFGYSKAEMADQVEGAVRFSVEADDFYGNGRLPGARLGQVLVRSDWSVGPAGSTRPQPSGAA